MSTWALRAAMVPVWRRVRAYFAPVDRDTGTPAIFDPGKHGAFFLENPPVPWLSLGAIVNFRRSSGTEIGVLRAGIHGAPVSQYRAGLDARVEFEFCEWGKLQMALAGGSDHMNVLAPDPSADAAPSGGTPIPAVPSLPGSTAIEIVVGVGVVDGFAVGELVAVDKDYQQEMGYVGTGIAAAYVGDPAKVNHDADYIRRITFNVGRVAQKTVNSLMLAQPLLGGPPLAGAGVQGVVSFVDREGGSFFQEWSALFVVEEESGGRACFYYPRLTSSAAQAGGGDGSASEGSAEIASSLSSLTLRASFLALPYVDGNDSQTVMCYRSYFPAASAAVY